MERHLWIIQTETGNVTVGSGERHDDGDDDDAGSKISHLPLNNKGIHAEGLFLNWIGSTAVFLLQQKSWQDKRESNSSSIKSAIYM